MRLRGTRLASIAKAGGAPKPSAPVNVSAPVISGAVYVGQTLSTTDGVWAAFPAPTYAYQWKRGGVDIGGATASTYVATLADEGQSVTCAVTATNIMGSSSATSNTLRHWVPTDLGSALKLWLDARDPASVTIATGVSQWNDKSGSANHFTQGTGSRQPAYTTGQRITLDGVDDYLQGLQILSVDHSIFICGNNRSSNVDINTSILSQDGGSNPDFWCTWRSTGLNNVQGLNTIGGSQASVSVTAPMSTDYVLGLMLPSTAGGGITSINGTQSTNGVAANDPAQLGTRLVLGSQKLSVSRYAGGDVLEVLITDTRLANADWQKAEGYLAWRDGTLATLAPSHPYKSTVPMP